MWKQLHHLTAIEQWKILSGRIENTSMKVPDMQFTVKWRKLHCNPQMLSDDTLDFGSCGSQWSAVTLLHFKDFAW